MIPHGDQTRQASLPLRCVFVWIHHRNSSIQSFLTHLFCPTDYHVFYRRCTCSSLLLSDICGGNSAAHRRGVEVARWMSYYREELRELLYNDNGPSRFLQTSRVENSRRGIANEHQQWRWYSSNNSIIISIADIAIVFGVVVADRVHEHSAASTSFFTNFHPRQTNFLLYSICIVIANLGGTPKTPILLRSRICRLETLVNLTSRTQGIGMGTHALSEGQILQFSTTTKHHYRDNFWSWSILFNQIWKKPYKASYIFAILLFFLSDIIFLVLIFGMFWNWSKAKGQPQDKSRFILEVKQ